VRPQPEEWEVEKKREFARTVQEAELPRSREGSEEGGIRRGKHRGLSIEGKEKELGLLKIAENQVRKPEVPDSLRRTTSLYESPDPCVVGEKGGIRGAKREKTSTGENYRPK